jgi:hypothetical protein
VIGHGYWQHALNSNSNLCRERFSAANGMGLAAHKVCRITRLAAGMAMLVSAPL